MADNYLERHYLEYEKRKEEWMRKKKHHAQEETSAEDKQLSVIETPDCG